LDTLSTVINAAVPNAMANTLTHAIICIAWKAYLPLKYLQANKKCTYKFFKISSILKT